MMRVDGVFAGLLTSHMIPQAFHFLLNYQLMVFMPLSWRAVSQVKCGNKKAKQDRQGNVGSVSREVVFFFLLNLCLWFSCSMWLLNLSLSVRVKLAVYSVFTVFLFLHGCPPHLACTCQGSVLGICLPHPESTRPSPPVLIFPSSRRWEKSSLCRAIAFRN